MAPRPYITSEQKLDDALKKWKNYSFVSNYLNLDAVIASLGTDSPMVEPFSPYRGAWKVRREVRFVCGDVHDYESRIDSSEQLAPKKSGKLRSIPPFFGSGIPT